MSSMCLREKQGSVAPVVSMVSGCSEEVELVLVAWLHRLSQSFLRSLGCTDSLEEGSDGKKIGAKRVAYPLLLALNIVVAIKSPWVRESNH